MTEYINPINFVITSIVLSVIAIGYCIFKGDLSLAIALMITSILFVSNLWGWIWASRIILNSRTREPDKQGNIGLVFAKALLFLPALFVIFLAFGGLPVLISNSIIVLSLCGTVFYTALTKRFSNE